MEKAEIIARRILGWKLNRWDRWYDEEKGVFIYGFNPEQNLDHAMLIVQRLEKFGYTYKANGETEVCFNEMCEIGNTLPEAITNAAFSLVEINPLAEEWQ